MKEKLIELYEDARQRSIRKKSYLSDIDALKEKYAGLLEELRGFLNDEDADLEPLCACITEHVQETLKDLPTKRKREMELLGHNMTMVSYFIPLLRDVKSLRADELAQTLAERWNQTFEGTKIGCPTVDQIQGGFRKGLCYITTAACESLAKPDGCRELALLRGYRDQYLMQTEEGCASVQEYYNVAPTIVKRINRREDASAVYEQIWKQYLTPCVRLIEENRLSECRDLYAGMVRDLAEEYLYRRKS